MCSRPVVYQSLITKASGKYLHDTTYKYLIRTSQRTRREPTWRD